MSSFVERTEGLIEELEQAEKNKTELRVISLVAIFPFIKLFANLACYQK